MTPKQIIALIIGLLGVAVTTWKGPQAWGLIASGLTAIVLFVSTLKITPKEDEEYIRDLEDALSKATDPQNPEMGLPLASRSRNRYARAREPKVFS